MTVNDNNVVVFSYPVRGSRPGKNVQLTEAEIRGLCMKSREIFLSQPILLELEAPLKICGKHICIHVVAQFAVESSVCDVCGRITKASHCTCYCGQLIGSIWVSLVKVLGMN